VQDTIKKDLTFHFAEHMDDVLKIALLDRPATPREAKPAEPAVVSQETARV
jgi:hypothetical protein